MKNEKAKKDIFKLVKEENIFLRSDLMNRFAEVYGYDSLATCAMFIYRYYPSLSL